MTNNMVIVGTVAPVTVSEIGCYTLGKARISVSDKYNFTIVESLKGWGNFTHAIRIPVCNHRKLVFATLRSILTPCGN